MSEAGARSFWKQNRAKVQIAAFVGAIALAIAIPFIQAPLCAVPASERNPNSYQLTIDRPYQPNTNTSGINSSISKFSFGPSVDSSVKEVEHTESRYYPAQQKEDWGRKYWCDVNASDYFLVLFTLALAVSTFLLWRETERLAEGAGDQSEKMRQSIREQRRSAFAALISAQAAKKSANAADRHSKAAIGSELPILQITRCRSFQDKTASEEDWIARILPEITIQNFGRATAAVTEVIINIGVGAIVRPNPRPVEFEKFSETIPLRTGESHTWTDFVAQHGITAEMKNSWLNDPDRHLHIWGEVRFRDFSGIHQQGFLFCWVPKNKEFIPLEQIKEYYYLN